MKKFAVVLLVSLMLIWIVGLGCWPLVMWSPLNCRYEEIDINSGRIRHRRYLLWTCVAQRVEESTLSKLLGSTQPPRPPHWRRVNTFSPMVRHSPHHYYHSAIHQIRWIEMLREMVSFTDAAKQKIAGDLLSIWQRDEGDFPAEDYIHRIDELVMEGYPSDDVIDVHDLPPVAAMDAPVP